MANQTTQLCLLTPSCFEILFADVNGCLFYNPCKYIIQVESKMRMLGTLSYYSVKHKIHTFFSSDHWQMERETNDECLRWTIFSCANVSILMRTVLFSDVIWGVDPAILVSNTLSSGHSVFLPKSRCSEPCDLGAVKVRHHGGVRVIIIIFLQNVW